MRLERTALVWLIAAGAPAATSVPAQLRAQAAICPQFLAHYCVVERDGFKHAAWTNPCFAKQRRQHIAHSGECRSGQ